ncbi:MAG: hypothetical protein GY749_22790 [Desulfobacteraceae bacterium]|nr:hypothetical protein [Desulfobacteraceae bacterium]
MSEVVKRGRGRPKKPEGEIKSSPLSFKTTLALRQKINQSAAEKGWSIAKEVEHRLQESIEDGKPLIDMLLEDKKLLLLILKIAEALQEESK